MKHGTVIIEGEEYALTKVGDKLHGHKIPKKCFVLEQNFKFEVYPHDAPKLMKYVDAEKWVKALGDGWKIPTQIELKLMYEQKDQIGGFKDSASDSDNGQWYWSCTENRTYRSYVYYVQFSDGDDGWNGKDNCALSVRPVRLMAESH